LRYRGNNSFFGGNVRLFRTLEGILLEEAESLWRSSIQDWDELINKPHLLLAMAENISELGCHPHRLDESKLLPPVGNQEVWAAGVTYYRSRAARIEESSAEASKDCYDRVYDAERPELFAKAPAHRVVGHGQPVRVRKDSTWNVPEPELALVVSASGEIVGYTIGNDMSSRDIEGQNPLYLPQAKIYDGSCALGPGVLVGREDLGEETQIEMKIVRGADFVFQGSSSLGEMKRSPRELVRWLYKELSFPHGCVLLTGTGIIPPSDFTLFPGDLVKISIGQVGTLENPVL
jgi:2-dehydro-3-deoxy-D-arabinonate dehydratase